MCRADRVCGFAGEACLCLALRNEMRSGAASEEFEAQGILHVQAEGIPQVETGGFLQVEAGVLLRLRPGVFFKLRPRVFTS